MSKLDEQIKIRLPAAMKKELKIHADSEGLQMADIVRKAMREYCSRHRRRRRKKML